MCVYKIKRILEGGGDFGDQVHIMLCPCKLFLQTPKINIHPTIDTSTHGHIESQRCNDAVETQSKRSGSDNSTDRALKSLGSIYGRRRRCTAPIYPGGWEFSTLCTPRNDHTKSDNTGFSTEALLQIFILHKVGSFRAIESSQAMLSPPAIH